MLQGAIAYYRATGDRTLLDAGIRFVDDFLLPNYGPGANQKGIVAGHPEIEMALVELYRTTGKRAYVDLAGYILHGDERIPLRPQQITYMFCGIPFTSRTIWKATPSAPCTPAAAPRTITLKPAIPPTGRR